MTTQSFKKMLELENIELKFIVYTSHMSPSANQAMSLQKYAPLFAEIVILLSVSWVPVQISWGDGDTQSTSFLSSLIFTLFLVLLRRLWLNSIKKYLASNWLGIFLTFSVFFFPGVLLFATAKDASGESAGFLMLMFSLFWIFWLLYNWVVENILIFVRKMMGVAE